MRTMLLTTWAAPALIVLRRVVRLLRICGRGSAETLGEACARLLRESRTAYMQSPFSVLLQEHTARLGDTR